MPKATRPQTMLWQSRNIGKSEYGAHIEAVLGDVEDDHREVAIVTKPVLPKDVKALFRRMGIIKPKRSRKK